MYKYYKDKGCIYEGLFKLTSGRYSDVYFNKNLVTLMPDVFNMTINVIIKRIKISIGNIDCITGPATAGAIFATVVANKLQIPFVYPDKTEDNQQVFKRGYDSFLKGKEIVIIEDVITTGGSVDKVVKSIYKEGGTVSGIICIWNREDYNSSNFPVYSLIDHKVQSWEKEDLPNNLKSIEPQDPKTLK